MSRTPLPTARRLLVGSVAAAVLLVPVACSDDAEETSTGDGATSTTGAGTSAPAADDAVVVGDVTITDVWARATPPGMTRTAVYLDLVSEGGDALVGVSVDPSVAAVAEIHETVMADGAMGGDGSMAEEMTTTMPEMAEEMTTTMPGMAEGSTSDTSMGGEMTMRPVERIELPAGETVSLAPGGYHIMLMELAAPLEEGQEIEVTIELEAAGEVTLTAPVRQP